MALKGQPAWNKGLKKSNEPGAKNVGGKPAQPASIEKIAHLRGVKGLTLEQIGKILGITKEAVWELCERHGIIKDGIANYRQYKLDMIEGKESLVLSNLTTQDIQKASARDKAVIFGILFEKGRLQSDRSTANIDVLGVFGSITERLKALQDERDKLDDD